jgi:mono/diheme cytochrome c family protein
MIRKVLKALAIGATVLLLAGAAFGAVTFVKSNAAIHRVITVDPPAVPTLSDSAALARGRHLAAGVMLCTGCHAEDLGGSLMIDARPFMRLAAPNLTRGDHGLAPRLSDADWARAIRHGVGHDGRALAVMPSSAYQHASDADVAAVIAYVKSVSPVNRKLPERAFGPVARFQLAQGKFLLFGADEINHPAVRSVGSPPPGVTLEYGEYLANVSGCTHCHGPGLSGGPVAGAPPGTPPAANITPAAIGRWTEEDFFRAVREGRGNGGRPLDPFMPWRSLRLTDDELRAVWLFVQAAQPKPFGNH